MVLMPAEKYTYVVERWYRDHGQVEIWKVAERSESAVHAVFGGFRDEAHAARIAALLNAAQKEE